MGTDVYSPRHGETVWHIKKLLHGSKDSPLKDKGVTRQNKWPSIYPVCHWTLYIPVRAMGQ
ncbi:MULTISPECIES: histidine phosphatase family protein [unclassified Sporosarcina]|uniref:histidine phosphatase family protein n=1 Tax=unclassified Sporosarcina TaxID=2647733 RepID=UPI00203D7F86|nr:MULTISPECIES: histidine phosphatase family protein [unclassified Sporosarcina]